MDSTLSGDPAGFVRFKAPEGTSVVSAPEGCATLDGEPGYWCDIGTVFEAGRTKSWTFKLKVGKAVTGEGEVKVLGLRALTDGDKPLYAANDTAKVTLTVGTTTPGAKPDVGKPLAKTGSSLPVPAAVAAGLVAVGVALTVLVRRRRTGA